MKTHWFITVVQTSSDDINDMRGPEDQRCWGYVEDFKEAEEVVVGNYSDIHECCYQWAIIEEHRLGVPAMPTLKYQWYHRNKDTQKYEKCDVPMWARNICSWGIG